MNAPPSVPPPIYPLPPAASPEKTLQRLFLTLFLRGRSSRGLRKETTPRSVGSKLALVLGIYSLIGLVAFAFARQTVFALSFYLHAMTFALLGMFVASSAGEILFNKDEGDILLHRPVTPKELLRAKVSVLVKVSLWLAAAFNFFGFIAGTRVPNGGWLYPVAHVLSVALEALFCTASVIVVYQLCLRWCGRERLEGLMTMAQVGMAVGAVLMGQVLPRVMMRYSDKINFHADSWWVWFLPPAWFAGWDEAIAGNGEPVTWILAATGLIATVTVLWLAFGKLAQDYETGLQSLSETTSTRPTKSGGRRWADRLVNAPPLRWWLRDSVSRASFLLCVAYLFRDRDVKLRVYPGIAPMLIMPFIFLFQDRGHHHHAAVSSGTFGPAFAGSYIGIITMLALNMLQYSQQWQASDIFRAAPLPGPALICHGARRAVLCLLTIPVLIIFGVAAWFISQDSSTLPLLLPGIIALPVYAIVPNLRGGAVPLSQPTEEAKSAGRGASMILSMMVSFAVAGLATWAWSGGWFAWLLLVETVLAVIIYLLIRNSVIHSRWPSLE